MLMLTRTHRREMAAKDDRHEQQVLSLRSAIRAEADAARYYAGLASAAEARLAKFTGPRERGQGGRFVKGGAK